MRGSENEEAEVEEALKAFRPRLWWLTRRRFYAGMAVLVIVLGLGAYMRSLYQNRHRLLLDAAYEGDIGRIRFLLRWGFDPTKTPHPVLDAAIYTCNVELLKLIVERGVPIKQYWNNPVSHVAQKSADCPETALEMIQYLVAHGAELNIENDKTTNREMRSILRVTSPDLLRYFLKSGVPPVQKGDTTSLLEARALRCEWKLILESGVDVNWRDPWGNTALSGVERVKYRALKSGCEMDDVEYARILLENGADPNIPDNEGLTALDHAYEREFQNKNLIALLKKYGAKSTRFKGAAEAASHLRAIQRREDIRTFSRALAPPGSRHGLDCDFVFRGQFGAETLISDGTWVLPLGEKREFDATCSIPSYLHFAVLLKDRTRDIPMSLNNRSNRGVIAVQFSELARDEELIVYHSASPIQDLAEALKTGEARPFRRINLVVWKGKN